MSSSKWYSQERTIKGGDSIAPAAMEEASKCSGQNCFLLCSLDSPDSYFYDGDLLADLDSAQNPLLVRYSSPRFFFRSSFLPLANTWLWSTNSSLFYLYLLPVLTCLSVSPCGCWSVAVPSRFNRLVWCLSFEAPYSIHSLRNILPLSFLSRDEGFKGRYGPPSSPHTCQGLLCPYIDPA